MLCKACGKELPDSAKFCNRCGTPVTEEPELSMVKEPEPPEVEKPEPPEVEKPEPPEVEKPEPPEVEKPEPPVVEEAEPPEVEQPEPPVVEEAEPLVVEEPEPLEVEKPEPPVVEEPELPVVEGPEPLVVEEPEPLEVEEPEPPVVEELEPPVVEEPEPPVVEEPEPPEVKEPELSVTEEPEPINPAAPPRRKKWGLIALGAVGVIALAAAVVAALRFLPGLTGGKGQTAYAYLSGGSLMYAASADGRSQPLLLSDKGGETCDVKFSGDGKTVYFIDGEGSLCRIAVPELRRGGRADRISRDVDGFQVLDGGKLLYTEDGGSGLNLYDGQGSFRLSRSCCGFLLGEDGQTLYYSELDEEGLTALYRMALSGDGLDQREELVRGANCIYTDYDAPVAVYGVERHQEGSHGNTLSVFARASGGEARELVSGVFSAGGVTVDGDGSVSFYYYTADAEEHTLYDFVTDEKAAEDAAETAEEPERPYWSSYSPGDLYIEDGTVYYNNGRGDSFPLDVSGLEVNNGELYYWDVYDVAYEDAQERFNRDLEEYNARYDQWHAAARRQELRAALKDTPFELASYDLWRCTDGGDGEAVASGLALPTWEGAPEQGVFLYKKSSGAGGGKVADVAGLENSGQVSELLYSQLSFEGEGGWYQNVGGTERAFSLVSEDAVLLECGALDGTELALCVEEDGVRSLRIYAIGAEELTLTTVAAEGEFAIPQQPPDGQGLYLFSNVVWEDGRARGDLCRYSAGRVEAVARDVYTAAVLEESGLIYAVGGIDGEGRWELAQVRDGALSVIAGEVGAVRFLEDGRMLYLGGGDLCLWDGRESRLLAENVEQCWASGRMTEEGVWWYWPGDYGWI